MRLPARARNGPATRLTDGLKWLLVFTMQQCLNVTHTAEIVGCSRGTVAKWWGVYETTGGVTTATPRATNRQLSEEGDRAALSMLTSGKGSNAQEVAQRLKQEGYVSRVLHKSTVIRAARRAAVAQGKKLWVQKGKPPKLMTQATMEKRLAFAIAHRNTNWATVLFTDRKKFLFRYPGSEVQPYLWTLGSASSSRRAVWQPNRPLALNLYGGISKYGVTKPHVVTGSSKHTSTHTNQKGQPARNITAGEYREVLTTTLLPEGKKLFSTAGVSSWTFQQDNDPTHRSASQVVTQWGNSKGSNVAVLPNWPPNSPDLNLIENLWGWVQQEVDKMGCITFDEFEAAVKSKLAAVSKKHLTNVWRSMPKRLAAVIKAGGGPTKY